MKNIAHAEVPAEELSDDFKHDDPELQAVGRLTNKVLRLLDGQLGHHCIAACASALTELATSHNVQARDEAVEMLEAATKYIRDFKDFRPNPTAKVH